MSDMGVDLEVAGESLEERLTRGAISFREALQISTDLAAALRDLHANGLEYGDLNAQTVVIGARGAGLAPGGGLAHKADGRSDVGAFGELMELMLDGAETPDHMLGLWAEAAGLAQQCLTRAPKIQQMVMPLRLLGVRARMALPAPPGDRAPAAELGARLESIALRAADALLSAATPRTRPAPANLHGN